MKPVFFAKQSDFRKWLEKNHLKEKELLVGFYKVGSGKPSITWPQSVDEALCFGWIDGIRRSIDEESYSIRFTPRKPKSIWSSVNIKKMAELKEKGLLWPAGIAAFEKREEKRSVIYSYEKAPVELSPEFDKKFKANKKAYAFFKTLPPSVQRVSLHWVMAAKQEKTRISRMESLIRDSEAGRKIKPLSYN
ncbi:MAG: bacteriocin-protection protein [Bacteroidetes bacterium]|nr:bacteriocin-protection protein [Bacteroidota bacterium]